MIYLIVLLLVVGVGLLVAGLWEAQHNAPESVAGKLTRIAEHRVIMAAPETISDEEMRRRFAQEEEKRSRAERRTTSQRKTTYLPSMSGLVQTHPLLARLELDLQQVRSPWRASELLAASMILTLLVFCVLYLLDWPILLRLLVSLLCLTLPWTFVRMQRTLYYRKFDEQLADTLLLMSNALKAGFSFLQSLEMVGREAPFPIADEFRVVTQEIAVGVPVSEALTNLGVRVKSMDLNLMVTAVIIQREVGGGLAEILETISGVIRERMQIKREIRTLTTQGRWTGGILAALPVALGLLLHITSKAASPGEPSFIEPLLHEPLGRLMLLVAITLQVIGFAVIMRIVSIRV